MKKDLQRKIAIITLALYVAGNSVVSGTLVFMQKDFGISLTNAEFLITLSSIATIVTMCLSERITRAFGMKKCVMLGLSLVGLSSILPIISRSYISIVISRLVMGAGVGLFNGHSANYINVFYEGDEANRLHGVRLSGEFIGQMVLLFFAGLMIKIHWTYAFLAYFFAFIIMINFNRVIPEVELEIEESNERLVINKQIIYYVFFAAMMIMNMSAISVRFPSIATLAKGLDVDVNMYLMILPIAGMLFAYLFGYINQILREKTVIVGLTVYVIADMILAVFGYNMYVFLLCMVLVAFSQSLCTPYLFAEVARLVKGSQQRMANNLIFVGCNLGGFLSPFFLSGVNKIFSTTSLTFAFGAMSIIYFIMLAFNLKEYGKIASVNKNALAN